MSRGGTEKEGDTESEAGSRLRAVSTEPDMGLELTDCEIMTWAEVGHLTDWATQVPQQVCCSKGHMHPHVYSSTIDNSQSLERAQMSIDGWMDKEDGVYIYTMEYYSAIKNNEILPFATTWMEGNMLSEISQRKTQIVWRHSYEDFKRQNRWT